MRRSLLVPALLALALSSSLAAASPGTDGPSVSADTTMRLAAARSRHGDGSRKAKSSGGQKREQAPVKHAPPPSANDTPAQPAGKPDAARPDAARPADARPNRPDAARPDAAQPRGPSLEAGPARLDAARPDAARPDAARPDAARPRGPSFDAGPARPIGDGPDRGGREPAGNRVPTSYGRDGHGPAGPDRADRAGGPDRHGPGGAARHAEHERQVHAVRHDLAAHHRHAVHRTWARHHQWWRPGPGHVWWRHHPVGWWRPAWAWGVFYYPPPYYAYPVYVDGGGTEPQAPPEVRREVDRARTFSLGARGGSYVGDYNGSGGFTDFGLGVAARYRATEALGFELGWQYHDETWSEGTERITQPFSASVELFAFPWRRFNPYVFTGLTWAQRNYQDTLRNRWGDRVGDLTVEDTLFGAHGGAGLEFGVGPQTSLNFEGRVVGYFNRPPEDPTVPLALQGTMGFNFYF